MDVFAKKVAMTMAVFDPVNHLIQDTEANFDGHRSIVTVTAGNFELTARSTAGPGIETASASLPLASARQGPPPASAGYKLTRARAAEPPDRVTSETPVSSRTAVATRSTAGPGAAGRSVTGVARATGRTVDPTGKTSPRTQITKSKPLEAHTKRCAKK